MKWRKLSSVSLYSVALVTLFASVGVTAATVPAVGVTALDAALPVSTVWARSAVSLPSFVSAGESLVHAESSAAAAISEARVRNLVGLGMEAPGEFVRPARRWRAGASRPLRTWKDLPGPVWTRHSRQNEKTTRQVVSVRREL